MNKDLQTILDFIQHSEHLNDEEKKSISKSLKGVDKELEITAFKLDRTEKTKKTTAILLKETIEELENKRKAVEAQNHELEIESSLERVRTVSMGMNKPDDMLQVCHTISDQLELLNVKEIRNVQTAIFYKEKGAYMNYEYYARHNKTFITETNYTNHEIHQDFADKMLKGNGEFMIAHIKGDKVKDWLAYQKTTNVFIDDYLNTASSLNYYWYSLGPVALGISTYSPLNEDETNLFKRFLKVFELSYRRYLDIEKAETQAREAKVEASLEKVRAVVMSMNKPDDLLNICETLFKEFSAFGFADLRNAMINIHDDEKKTFVNYDYSDEIGKSTNHLAFNTYPVIEKQIVQVRSSNDAFSETVFAGEDLGDWKKFRKEIGEKDDPRINKTAALHYYFHSIGTGSIGISTFTPVREEKLKLLKRFRNVFNLSYQRYTDLALAEAQAREAKIELALERVRARTMAMQNSDELHETTLVLLKQFKDLGQIASQVSIAIFDNEINNVESYITLKDDKIDRSFTIEIEKDPFVWSKARNAFLNDDKLFIKQLTGQELQQYNHWRNERAGSSLYDESDNILEQTLNIYVAFFSKGAITFSTNKTVPDETLKLIERFGKVFEQTYTRFLDLQKAEAQARESQIQLALERVRARTMAMQKSDELKEAAALLFQQVKSLGVPAYSCGYNIWEKNEKTFTSWMSSEDGSIVNAVLNIPLTEDANFIRYDESKQKGEQFFVLELRGKRMQEHYQYLKTIPAFKEYFDYAVSMGFDLPETQIHFLANFSHGNLLFITLETCPEFHDVFKRFAAVFEQTYTRFLDLQKAEAQSRDSQIQLALERVRARTMAMQKSDELAETASLLFKQLLGLGIKSTQMRTCAITTLKPDEPIGECWITKPDGDIIPHSFMVPYNETSAYKTIYASWKNGEKFLVVNLSGDALVQHLNFLKKYAKIPTQQFEALPDQPTETFTHAMFFSQGYLFIISNEPLPEYHEIFKRFGAIFQQTYTRFLDLQKAETQARESQIQLALERVRARTMAMQKSEELSETVFILFQQFKQLGENPDQATIGIINEEECVIEYWVTMYGNQTNRVYKFPIDELNVTNRIYKGWQEQKRSLVIELSGKELYDFANFRESMGGASYNEKEKKRVINVAFFSKGLINVQSNETRSEESIRLLERFAAVFEQTYTRFLDLQKAEAQAREAQIEASLERVRSRSMAMQKSEELKDVIQVVYDQFVHLNIQVEHTGFIIDYKERDDMYIWLADKHSVPFQVTIPFFDCAHWNSFNDAREKGADFFTNHLGFEEKNKFYYELFKLIPGVPEETLNYYFNCPGLAISTALLDNIGLYIENFSGIPFSENENKTLMRFGKVFQQTYTRFLDLQKAEAQVRESQIESSLERVRSRSMGMQKSDELGEVIQVIYEQLVHLNFKLDGAGFAMDYRESDDFNFWLANSTLQFPTKVHIPYLDHPQFNRFKEAKEKGLDFFVSSLTVEEKNRFFDHALKYSDSLPEEIKEAIYDAPGYTTSHVFLKNVILYILNFSGVPFSDAENATLMRFGKAFEQTYIRFNDLEKAEAQALEAVKRASVDRVRAEIASMRTTDDLEKITPLIWNELTVLSIPFIRCGVFIMAEEQQQVQTFLYTEGKTIASFTSTYSNSKIITEALPFWRRKEIYQTHWNEAAFLEQAKSLVEQGAITTGEKYLTEHRPTDLYLHFLPFLQGMLYVGNATSLSEKHLQLVQALADAFSTAYARYEDFNKLEAAKQQVDKTLLDLKQTQTQLIQSEKMASLGELTAGIAHEIQNPLNFVNNFSEVSNELISEMVEEVDKGNTEEVKAIANDLKQNLEKINHHGKRADAIVKGMLQHTRTSSGQKEPTDVNVLSDEYLRLAYHGLRAKDKSFNAKLETDFDNSIDKINVVPQDIGRVILNLLTNAFYAVNERIKMEGSGYQPTVSVSTKKSETKISITVSDNGSGIPKKVVDKIFQPFFTTKPTGQGTGLGLSLSYDIIKAHSGEIKVVTKENEGTTFIIQLPIV